MLFRKKIARPEPFFFLARRHGLAYLQVPKVACTSFKVALALLNRPELEPEITPRPMQIHIRPDWNDQVTCHDKALAGLFRFTFVRHPVKRMLSMYWDKIVNPREPEVWPSLYAHGLRKGMPLAQVLDIMERTALAVLDQHLTPQSALIYDGEEPRTQFVGHIERLQEGMDEIARRSGIRLEPGHHNHKRADAPAPPPSAPDDLARIERFYADDFSLLGYTPEHRAA